MTYKSTWERCDRCSCLSREVRPRYPLEWLARFIPAFTPRARALRQLFGRKATGTDYYRYYENFISRGDEGKWAGEYTAFQERLSQLRLSLDGRSLLDISGEPGFFGREASRSGATEVTVTAFADNVADAMREHLRLAAFPYDFNSDRLSILAGRQFDWICCRYAIGFCERLDDFFADLGLVASPGGYVYMSFSPPSLGVCSRWMFDDYTYLRQYTLDTVLVAALKAGFDVVRVFDDGSYRYDHGLHWVQKLVTEVYRKLISRSLTSGSDYYRLWQHNVAVLLRRGPKDGDHVLPMPSSFPHL